MEPSTAAALPMGYLLTKIARAVATRFAERIAPLGIRPGHFGVLSMVAATPSGSQLELGRMLGVAPSALVALIDELEARGAVQRTVDAADRRRSAIAITDSGRDLLTAAMEAGAKVDDELLAGIPPSDRAVLHRLLATVADHAGVLPG